MVPVVDVLVHPIAAPFNAASVVDIVAEHHQPPVRRAFVEVEVVLVADVVVPVSHKDFDGGQFQKPIDVKNGLEFALEIAVARGAHHVAQISDGGIVVFLLVRFELVGALRIVPRRGEFVCLGVVSKVGEVGRVGALPEVAMVVFEPLLDELFVHVFHVDVQPAVFLIDVDLHMADARCDVPLVAHVFPDHACTKHRGVVVVAVEVEFFESFPFGTGHK